MPTEVVAAPRAEQQIGGLTRKQAKAFDNFLNELAANGCRALAYRLSGHTPLDHMCVKHLAGPCGWLWHSRHPSRRGSC